VLASAWPRRTPPGLRLLEVTWLAGSLGHADYGPAISWLPLQKLGRSMGPPACGSFFFSSEFDSDSKSGAYYSTVTPVGSTTTSRRAATARPVPVRCRHMHPRAGAVLTRRWPSAMPTGARNLVGQVRDYSPAGDPG
jgi:hypothetical protein